MFHAQLAVWIPWSVQYLYLQGYFLSASTHETVEVTTAAQAALFGYRAWRETTVEVGTSQKNIPSRTFPTLSPAKDSQIDDHLVGICHSCGQTRSTQRELSIYAYPIYSLRPGLGYSVYICPSVSMGE